MRTAVAARRYYDEALQTLIDRLGITPVDIVMPATMPPGVSGQDYVLDLVALGTGPIYWEQNGDSIPGELIADAPDGRRRWSAVAPAPGSYAIKFDAIGPLSSDQITYTWTVNAAPTHATITGPGTLAAQRVGQPADLRVTCAGDGPYRFRMTGQQPPAGAALKTTAINDPASESLLAGTPQAGSETQGSSCTLYVTGATGVESAGVVFAGGFDVNRDPDCTNEGQIPVLQPGGGWSYQLNIVGRQGAYTAVIERTGGAAWPAWVTSLTPQGMLSGTDPVASAGTSTGNIELSVRIKDGGGVDLRPPAVVNINLTVAAAPPNNAPPIAVTEWLDPDASVTMSGGGVTSWAGQQAGHVFSASGYTAPTKGTNRIVFGPAPSRRNLAFAGLSLPVPWHIYGYIDTPVPPADGTGDRIWHDTSGSPRVVYSDNGANQRRIVMVQAGGTTTSSDQVIRGGRNKIQVWGTATGCGIRVNGVEVTDSVAAEAWSGMILGGTTDATSLIGLAVGRWGYITGAGNMPDAAGRAALDDYMDNLWQDPGGGGGGPGLDIVDERTDSRTLDYFVPSRGFADASATMQWHHSREAAIPPQPNQVSGWEGYVRNIPAGGLPSNVSGSILGAQIVDCPVNGATEAVVKLRAGNGLVGAIATSPNKARGRMRIRSMNPIRWRCSSNATPPTRVWAAFRLIFGPGSFVNTDTRQGLFALTHYRNLSATSNGMPANGPGVYISSNAALGQQGGASMFFQVMRFRANSLNDGTVLSVDNLWNCQSHSGVAPAEGPIYDFVFDYTLSYDPAEGFINGYMRSPRHYGGVITKIISDRGANFGNDSAQTGPSIGPQVYDWRPYDQYAWTAPATQHVLYLGAFVTQRHGAGSVAQSPAMYFDLLAARAKRP